jgi:2-oxoglutarate/2-oxoacid ferredoxin oxidoreductase subunit beta
MTDSTGGNNCVTHTDYNSDNKHTWCDGCGNYSIWGAIRNSLVKEQIAPEDILFIHDIGCNGNGADKIDGYGFKGLHGRALPLAAGASIANSRQLVIASSGDGAILAEGIGHLIHTIRSNYNITFIIHNNSNFALTTGQASPATPLHTKMNGSPDGVQASPINISQLVLNLQPSFYARGFSGKQKQLASLITEANKHKGFSIVEVLQSCPSYNYFMSNDWYLKRIFDVNENTKYDSSNLGSAISITKDLEDKIATGLIYKNEWNETFMKSQKSRDGISTELIDEVNQFDISSLVDSFRD